MDWEVDTSQEDDLSGDIPKPEISCSFCGSKSVIGTVEGNLIGGDTPARLACFDCAVKYNKEQLGDA